jgi:hypothetical protein
LAVYRCLVWIVGRRHQGDAMGPLERDRRWLLWCWLGCGANDRMGLGWILGYRKIKLGHYRFLAADGHSRGNLVQGGRWLVFAPLSPVGLGLASSCAGPFFFRAEINLYEVVNKRTSDAGVNRAQLLNEDCRLLLAFEPKARLAICPHGEANACLFFSALHLSVGHPLFDCILSKR